MELRYPVSLNPSATIYLLSFLEAGNSWNDYKKYNPFKVKRSAGLGVRIFLPMFGLLGLDYGFGFDSLDLVLREKLIITLRLMPMDTAVNFTLQLA